MFLLPENESFINSSPEQTDQPLKRTPCCVYYIYSGHNLRGQGEGYSVGCNAARCYKIRHTGPLRFERQITELMCDNSTPV